MVNQLVDLDGLKALAHDLAQKMRQGDVVLLHGPLGAGKTTFARTIIEDWAGPEADAASPSFPICLTYETAKGHLWHYDLYRLTPPVDLENLGWSEARHSGTTLVEWPERAGIIGGPGYSVTLSFSDSEDTRNIMIEDLS